MTASLTEESVVSASAWFKGISLSVLASIIGGASKLAIRKSWLMDPQQHHPEPPSVLETPIDVVGAMAGNNNNSNDSDNLIRYSQIANHVVENDSHQPIQDDHYSAGNHRQDGVRTNRFIPILLRISGMIGMTTLNPLCSVLAMNYASPSILAPFAGLTLVWIVLFSEALVGEQPTARQVVAAALIVIGEVVIAIFGDHTNDEGISVIEVVRYIGQSYLVWYIYHSITAQSRILLLLHLLLSSLSSTGSFVSRT